MRPLVGVDQPRDAARDRRLARPRLADDAERFAAADLERHIGRRRHARASPRRATRAARRSWSSPRARHATGRRRGCRDAAARGSAPTAISICVYSCCGARQQRRASARSPPARRARSTATRSAISATTPKSCVMNSTPVPCSRMQLADQREDLRLRRDVERRRRLVGDQQRGLEHQRHRDHDPLPLAARQLVRIRRHHPRRIGQLDVAR